MRVIVIGATGVVGSAVADALANRGHEVLRASRQGPISVNIADAASIAAMYEAVGQVDAVVCCAGTGAFKPLTDTTDEDIAVTLQNKVVGPMNLVRSGVSHMRDGGVFVLTAGSAAQQPIPGVTVLATACGALESFARAATLDLPRDIRVTTISPPFIKETAEKMGYPGGLPAETNAEDYVEVVEGREKAAVISTGE